MTKAGVGFKAEGRPAREKRRLATLAAGIAQCDPLGMATGLKTFDNFTWASLLKGRTALVVDRDGARGRRYGAALEEAGAIVTLAPNQVVGADRAKDETFRLILIGLTGEEAIAVRFAPALARPGTDAVLLAETTRHESLRAAHEKARIGDHTMGDRDLVMFVVGTPDE